MPNARSARKTEKNLNHELVLKVHHDRWASLLTQSQAEQWPTPLWKALLPAFEALKPFLKTSPGDNSWEIYLDRPAEVVEFLPDFIQKACRVVDFESGENLTPESPQVQLVPVVGLGRLHLRGNLQRIEQVQRKLSKHPDLCLERHDAEAMLEVFVAADETDEPAGVPFESPFSGEVELQHQQDHKIALVGCGPIDDADWAWFQKHFRGVNDVEVVEMRVNGQVVTLRDVTAALQGGTASQTPGLTASHSMREAAKVKCYLLSAPLVIYVPERNLYHQRMQVASQHHAGRPATFTFRHHELARLFSEISIRKDISLVSFSWGAPKTLWNKLSPGMQTCLTALFTDAVIKKQDSKKEARFLASIGNAGGKPPRVGEVWYPAALPYPGWIGCGAIQPSQKNPGDWILWDRTCFNASEKKPDLLTEGQDPGIPQTAITNSPGGIPSGPFWGTSWTNPLFATVLHFGLTSGQASGYADSLAWLAAQHYCFRRDVSGSAGVSYTPLWMGIGPQP